MYWFRLSWPVSMYTVSSGLVGHDLRLQIPDVSPATVPGIFRGGCFNCCCRSTGGWLTRTSHYYARLHRESIEIHKHEHNFNKKEESKKLNKTWFPALKNRKTNKAICNQSDTAKCRTTTNQHPGRRTANKTPGQHRNSDPQTLKVAKQGQKV
jgi:hypothetical protein